MEKVKKELEIAQRKNKQTEIKKEVEKIIGKLAIIKEKMTELKAEVINIKSMQLTYYHSLMYDGLDVRTDGLIWIIKCIWLLGYNVNLAKMPAFLDPEAVSYLFRVFFVIIVHSMLNSVWNWRKYKKN